MSDNVFKYKPYKKVVTKLSKDGSEIKVVEETVKDSYILVKSNGDSVVGDAKLMKSFGYTVTENTQELQDDSTVSKIVNDDLEKV